MFPTVSEMRNMSLKNEKIGAFAFKKGPKRGPEKVSITHLGHTFLISWITKFQNPKP